MPSNNQRRRYGDTDVWHGELLTTMRKSTGEPLPGELHRFADRNSYLAMLSQEEASREDELQHGKALTVSRKPRPCSCMAWLISLEIACDPSSKYKYSPEASVFYTMRTQQSLQPPHPKESGLAEVAGSHGFRPSSSVHHQRRRKRYVA